MKLQFKVQQYQTDAVDAVVDCFAGQPKVDGISYRIDPGRGRDVRPERSRPRGVMHSGLRNAEIALNPAQLLENLHAVQRSRGLPLSKKLERQQGGAWRSEPRHRDGDRDGEDLRLHQDDDGAAPALRVEQVHRRRSEHRHPRGREEVVRHHRRALPAALRHEATVVHLQLVAAPRAGAVQLGRRRPGDDHQHPGVQRPGKDQRRIYDELDDFQSRRPIDVIKANRPIVIIDEPQKMGADKSLKSLAEFNALMVLRYSATHRVEHNKVHRLDAVDAYNQKLVKSIAVRGITVKGLAGTTAYLYLDAIEVKKGAAAGGADRARGPDQGRADQAAGQTSHARARASTTSPTESRPTGISSSRTSTPSAT